MKSVHVKSTQNFSLRCVMIQTAVESTCFNYQLNARFLYYITICMLHYNPRHVSSINMPIFRRTNCIITTSGIVTLCMYSMPDESRLQSSRLQRSTIPDVVITQFVLLKMGMLMPETCRWLQCNIHIVIE
jgi:hypothetical protein